MEILSKVVCLLVLAQCAFGQEIIEKECSSYPITTQQQFSVDQYLGEWHELMRYENVFQKDGACVTANYSINEEGKVGVKNAMRVNGEQSSIEGFAVESNPDLKDGKLTVQFPGSPAANYWVLETDYENYSVVWSCYNFSGKSLQYLWVLARQTLVPTEVSKNIERVLAANGLDANLLKPTNNDKNECGFE